MKKTILLQMPMARENILRHVRDEKWLSKIFFMAQDLCKTVVTSGREMSPAGCNSGLEKRLD
ncbi:hypothetical protein [Endozoicomonas sp. ONNA2]|uniref:hypothetical protein n=1 Tax=Endozoicomonas sp. ONNA2 TaxID=2828741 RepID=UPI002148D8A4|nr:hypothetical protein [Endozoicomonas sp. ONNA2]